MGDQRRERIFISYSHKDRHLCDEFKAMVAPAVRTGLIDIWDDTKIVPGEKWQRQISTALASASVAVLLVSKHFLASEFIAKHELPPLLTAAREDGLTVFWVLLSDCLYQTTEIVTYQAAHDPAKPLDLLRKPQRDAVLRQVCAKLLEVTAKTPSLESVASGLTDMKQQARPPRVHANLATTTAVKSPERRVIYRLAPITFEQNRGRRVAELSSLFDRGFKAVLVCGFAATGKSELVSGFTRVNTIIRRRAQISLGRLSIAGPTMPGEVWYQIVAGREKRVLIDPSGEFFALLDPQERARLSLPDLTPDHFVFMKRAVKQLAGIVLVFDLTHQRDANGEEPWRDQENAFHFFLAAIRWLRFDGQGPEPPMGLRAAIAAHAATLPPIDVPILVAFTKADKLASLPRRLPLEFARRQLAVLHAALCTHACRYRYDFCHTMISTSSGDRPVERPVGVLLPFEWLLSPPWSWMPRIPTRVLDRR